MLRVLYGAVARRSACRACSGQSWALQSLVVCCQWPSCVPASCAPLYIKEVHPCLVSATWQAACVWSCLQCDWCVLLLS